MAQTLGDRGTWPLVISAVIAGGTTPAPIFVYQRAGSGSSLNGDSFSCVADVMHMLETAEEPTDDCPFFRKAALSVVCRSQAHVLEFWNEVVDAVQTLADETAAADIVETISTVTITSR